MGVLPEDPEERMQTSPDEGPDASRPAAMFEQTSEQTSGECLSPAISEIPSLIHKQLRSMFYKTCH